MSFDALVAELKSRYEGADESEVVLSIHVFGIAFAEQLDGHSVNDLAEQATGHRSYGAEIRKGMRLAKYVVLK